MCGWFRAPFLFGDEVFDERYEDADGDGGEHERGYVMHRSVEGLGMAEEPADGTCKPGNTGEENHALHEEDAAEQY